MSRRPRLCARPKNVPPDAGASYLGAYTFNNPWTLWLLEHEPGMLAQPPSALHQTDIGTPPACTAQRERIDESTNEWRRLPWGEECGEPMTYRPGAWCCYRHGETVRIPTKPKYERGTVYDDNDQPIRDVTQLIDVEADVMFFTKPGETKGKWRLVRKR